MFKGDAIERILSRCLSYRYSLLTLLQSQDVDQIKSFQRKAEVNHEIQQLKSKMRDSQVCFGWMPCLTSHDLGQDYVEPKYTDMGVNIVYITNSFYTIAHLTFYPTGYMLDLIHSVFNFKIGATSEKEPTHCLCLLPYWLHFLLLLFLLLLMIQLLLLFILLLMVQCNLSVFLCRCCHISTYVGKQ